MRLILPFLAAQFCFAQSVAMPGPGVSRAGAWPNGYSFRRSITIDHTKVSTSNQTNFPVLVCFNGGTGTNCDAANSNTLLANLKTTGNGGQVQHTVSISTPYTHTIPADVIITDTDGSTVLPFEVVTYTASSGLIEMWVKIGTLTTASDYVIYIYYGNASVTTDQSSSAAAWNSNFKRVYHMPDGSTLDVSDSTGTANGTKVGTPTAVAAQNDGGMSVNGTTQYVNAGAAAISGQITIGAWVNITAFPSFGTLGSIISDKLDSGPGNVGYYLDLFNNAGTVALRTGSFQSNVTFGTSWNISGWSTGGWHHVAGVYNGTAWKLYFDGVQVATTNAGTGAANFSTNTFVGSMDIDGTAGRFLSAKFDEVRISNTGLSVDWLLTSFNNQNSPNTFYTLGAEQ